MVGIFHGYVKYRMVFDAVRYCWDMVICRMLCHHIKGLNNRCPDASMIWVNLWGRGIWSLANYNDLDLYLGDGITQNYQPTIWISEHFAGDCCWVYHIDFELINFARNGNLGRMGQIINYPPLANSFIYSLSNHALIIQGDGILKFAEANTQIHHHTLKCSCFCAIKPS